MSNSQILPEHEKLCSLLSYSWWAPVIKFMVESTMNRRRRNIISLYSGTTSKFSQNDVINFLAFSMWTDYQSVHIEKATMLVTVLVQGDVINVLSTSKVQYDRVVFAKDNTVILPCNTYRKQQGFTSAESLKGVVFELKLIYRRIFIISLYFFGIVVVLVDLWCSPLAFSQQSGGKCNLVSKGKKL